MTSLDNIVHIMHTLHSRLLLSERYLGSRLPIDESFSEGERYVSDDRKKVVSVSR